MLVVHPTFKINSYDRRGSPDPAVEIPDLSGSRYANVLGDLRSDPYAGSPINRDRQETLAQRAGLS